MAYVNSLYFTLNAIRIFKVNGFPFKNSNTFATARATTKSQHIEKITNIKASLASALYLIFI